MVALDGIQSRKLDLYEDINFDVDPHRPNLRIWADVDDNMSVQVSISISAMWGQPIRFIDLSPDEARTLAVLLKQVADDVDNIEK